MQGYDIIGIEAGEILDRLADIILFMRRQMEAADDHVDLVDAGSRLRLFDDIDDAAMAARGQDDQAPLPTVRSGAVAI